MSENRSETVKSTDQVPDFFQQFLKENPQEYVRVMKQKGEKGDVVIDLEFYPTVNFDFLPVTRPSFSIPAREKNNLLLNPEEAKYVSLLLNNVGYAITSYVEEAPSGFVAKVAII